MTNPWTFPSTNQLLSIVNLLLPLLLSSSTGTDALSMSTSTSNADSAYHNLQSVNANNDAYEFLEEVDSDESLAFAKAENAKCLEALGNPEDSEIYQKLLKVLENNDRIPYGNKVGNVFGDPKEGLIYNFWKDDKNIKGLLRRTTMSSYVNGDPIWEPVLDVDKLAEKDGISWVSKGNVPLPVSRDDVDKSENRSVVSRTLIRLSDGGADAIYVKEFCLKSKLFVSELPSGGEDDPLANVGFELPEAKSRILYKSRDVLLVGSDFGPGTMTDSGYPMIFKEWVRGTKLEDAPIVFQGEKTDVSVSVAIDDERFRNGHLLETHTRSTSFYTSRVRVRKLRPEHLYAVNDPRREGIPEPPEFVWLDIPDDSDPYFFSTAMTVELRSEWNVGGKTYKKGSLLYCDFDEFISKGKENVSFSILFEPTDNRALNGFTATQNFITLRVFEDVKSKLVVMRFCQESKKFVVEGGDEEAQICESDVWAVDRRAGDDVWCDISSFTQPSTLYKTNINDIKTNTTTAIESSAARIKSLPPQYDAENIDVVQKMATSADGTLVPYFIVKRKDTVYDGNNPTLLYGYGGFEISLTPHYVSTQGVSWLERGGVYVEANIRGGGEYGPRWHQAALKENRMKAYEDFIAVGEDLCKSGICKPSTLGARGGSNGGLLMGMMLVLRPDLFGAIHCAVPLLDMKRFHLLLAGASWMAEYGNPDEDFENYLHKYSPFHLIDPEKDYSPFLVTTSTR